MKRVLITGKNSYIGTSFENWLARWPDDYEVYTLDMLGDDWQSFDFSGYDVVFHVAGIAHVKETKHNRDLYFKVNRDLAIDTARKAKAEGVKHFVFLSTMSVYGLEKGVITRETLALPKNAYGKSKLEAEDLIKGIEDHSFTVATLRPPMVYGKGCRGNYPRLARLALKTPVFPMIENKRSMIYIDNLSSFIRLIIDQNRGGCFFPQNEEYANTSELVQMIATIHGKRIKLTKIFNPLIFVARLSVVGKVFGSLTYDKEMADLGFHYWVQNFSDSIKTTEGESSLL